MKFANIERGSLSEVALAEGGTVIPLRELAPWLEGWSVLPATTDELLRSPEQIAQIEAARARAIQAEARLGLDASVVRYLPAVLNPGKLICIGLNYRRHAEETNMPLPAEPVVFGKFSDSVTAHGTAVPYPVHTRQLDYEAELAIVIGRTASNVSEADALDYVFGYCCANDLSARDLQMRSGQWLLGKTGEGFAPLGPFIATADEIADPNRLRISARVNGVAVQQSNTSDMIFSCREIIAYLSRHFTLRPGDVILTGTPEGVILGKPEAERVWLKPGDEMTISIEGLGELTNIVGE
ncbi:fumarylacetoacetate hydrolase family protein [Saccharibacillus brassicae]|uniref:Fumarylacetoacetate hydrolase family protein n=1 Tax=Saccharibacillus brassicae TaxID=2583377 RepID=A0A4Y6V4X7_SACBS|nr:fumarylacetoacetate hydrolase family protein [Saccharibacillus brassicae]QDH23567.1 fumarylacetoacetate hydrolase family protein [Saccharibacillus brassicae]